MLDPTHSLKIIVAASQGDVEQLKRLLDDGGSSMLSFIRFNSAFLPFFTIFEIFLQENNKRKQREHFAMFFQRSLSICLFSVYVCCLDFSEF
jgi:hypothetical protein